MDSLADVREARAVFEVPSDFILDKEHCDTLDEAMTKHTNEALAVADASDWV